MIYFYNNEFEVREWTSGVLQGDQTIKRRDNDSQYEKAKHTTCEPDKNIHKEKPFYSVFSMYFLFNNTDLWK